MLESILRAEIWPPQNRMTLLLSERDEEWRSFIWAAEIGWTERILWGVGFCRNMRDRQEISG